MSRSAPRAARNGSPGCLEGFGAGAAERCQTHDLWEELGRQILLFLQGVTLADVVPAECRAAPCR